MCSSDPNHYQSSTKNRFSHLIFLSNMPVQTSSDKISLQHPKGASVEILLYGASVVSWKAPSPNDSAVAERLFVSSKASLDGSKPVRGGIPVVFPAFGPPTHPEHLQLPQHGFARSYVWTYDSTVMDNEAGVSVRLLLEPNDEIKAIFKKAFQLTYVVTLAEHQLSTDLHVTNPSTTEVIPFQALFHTYYRAPSADVVVKSLAGLKYIDKTASTDAERSTLRTETRSEVDVKQYTDSVYEDAPQSYEVIWPGDGLHIKTKNLKDLVVWNPQAEAGSKIGDMEDGGWNNYVCVEPGHVRGFIELQPGKRWIGQQVMTVVGGGKRSS